VPFDEGLELLQGFTESNEFFDDYSHVDLVELICVMDILHFNPKAPIVKLGETSTWVGVLLKGTVDVYVKGTKVGKIPTGAMIGDTGTIEGGKRSADCEGSEGGGIIALLRFDKMDRLHAHQPRLAYKLAMSFGGVVVRKLRQAMGKVFKKDNSARAGENIGRRRLMIPPESRLTHKYRLPDDPLTDEDEDDAIVGGGGPDATPEQLAAKKIKAKKRWSKVKRAISATNGFKAVAGLAPIKDAPHELNDEEILYLARGTYICFC
jgi:CRP-like cAMP-binding protein